MASVANSLLDALVSAVQGLALSGVTSSQVRKRALPKIGETIDGAGPWIFVAIDADAIITEQLGFDDRVNVLYPVEVAVIDAVNRDYLTKLPTFCEWRQVIARGLAGPTLSGVASIWQTIVRPAPLFDRSLLSKQYGYVPLSFQFHSSESRV